MRSNKMIKGVKKFGSDFFEGDFFGLAAEISFYLLSTFLPMIILVFTVASSISLNYTDAMFKVLQVLPKEVEKLIKTNKVAFAGDGINDAPTLAMADVGIAMGAIGSDAAIEAADIVIMDDSLKKIPYLISFAKRTRNIVWQNIVFAILVKILVMALSLFNMGNMWIAVFADVGVSVIAILNAIRIKK